MSTPDWREAHDAGWDNGYAAGRAEAGAELTSLRAEIARLSGPREPPHCASCECAGESEVVRLRVNSNLLCDAYMLLGTLAECFGDEEEEFSSIREMRECIEAAWAREGIAN